jgi:hypothetical protein
LEEIKVGAFEGLSQLTSLDLSYNSLRRLDKGVFDPLSKLVQLNISNNQLADLQPGLFSNLKNLEKLSLDNNIQLNRKSLKAFEGLRNLKDLSIRSTPLAHESLELRAFFRRKCEINGKEGFPFYVEFIGHIIAPAFLYFYFKYAFELCYNYGLITRSPVAETEDTTRIYWVFFLYALHLFLLCLEELDILKRRSAGRIVMFISIFLFLTGFYL